jgi:hypothetical protein
MLRRTLKPAEINVISVDVECSRQVGVRLDGKPLLSGIYGFCSSAF